MKDEIHPTIAELQEARRHTKKALERSRNRLQKDEELTLCLEWIENESVLDNMDGAAGRTLGSKTVKVRFNTGPSEWIPALKSSVAHEFAHAWHYEQRGQTTTFVWQYVLDEAITQNFAERVYPEYRAPMSHKHSREMAANFWPQIKEKELDRKMNEISWPHPLYIDRSGDGEYPNWLGYSMSYLLGKELLEGRELEEMPGVSRQELVDAGDRLFAKP